MKNIITADKIRLIAGAALLAALTGCVVEPTNQRSTQRGHLQVQAYAAVGYHDDYDYYPAHEVYYSRNRQEYVYRDGSSWVRRPAPSGITVTALFASPSVRMEFQDQPEHHHDTVVKSYPRNWKNPGKKSNDKDDRKDDKRDDKKDHDRRD